MAQIAHMRSRNKSLGGGGGGGGGGVALGVKIKENEEKFYYICGKNLAWQQLTQGEHMEKAMTATHLASTARCTFIRSEVDVKVAGWSGKSGNG